MKILVFTEGTILAHASSKGRTREEIVRQSLQGDPTLNDFVRYIPIGNPVAILSIWHLQGADIFYLTSRTIPKEIEEIVAVLKEYRFPNFRQILFRQNDEAYQDVVEQLMPDILIEDDCESIGEEREMAYPQISANLKLRIHSIVVKEFEGIDHLPDDCNKLLVFQES